MSNGDNLYEFDRSTVIIRSKFLKLTDKNICAASLLDRFNAEIATGLELTWYDRKREARPFDYTVEFSVNYLAHIQCDNLFTEEEIIEGLNLLIERGYIRVVGKSETTYTFFVDMAKLDNNTGRTPYKTLSPQTPQPITEDLPISRKKSTQEVSEAPATRRRNERKRVEYHNNRASRVGLPATLTASQWTKTLEHFYWRCALCTSGKYDVLEHFIPLIHGGGTTEYNCIPACTNCNRMKHDRHPSMIPESEGMAEALKSVQAYLETRRSEAMS